MRKMIVIACIVVGALSAPTHAAFLAALDFDSPSTTGAGVSLSFGPFTPETATVGAWNAAGWAGTYAANRTTGNPAGFTTLLLSGLAPHTSVTASFILGFLESWDSRNGSPAPDELEVWIDGTLVASMTSNNAGGSITDFDGGTVLASGIQANTLFFFSDTLVNMAGAPFLTFAHSASTLMMEFRASGAGWQGGTDEAWGIDNIRLDYDAGSRDPVPEPASLALMLTGLAGIALRRRSRQAANR